MFASGPNIVIITKKLRNVIISQSECGLGVMRLLSPQRELESNLTANVLKDYANFNIYGFAEYISCELIHVKRVAILDR